MNEILLLTTKRGRARHCCGRTARAGLRLVATLVLVFCALLPRVATFPVAAQEPVPQWRYLTGDDGLAANDVWTVMQAQDGALWFGTSGGGASRFNGRWIPYDRENTDGGLASNWVRSIVQSSDGSLWMGTSRGVSRFHEETWEFFNSNDGLPGDDVSVLRQTDDGIIRAGTNSGLASYDGQTWQSFTSEDGLTGGGVNALWQDTEGMLWVGSDLGLNYCQVQPELDCVQVDDLGGMVVSALFQDRDGRLWAATGRGMAFYDSQMWSWLEPDDRLPSGRVRSMVQDDQGVLYFATDRGVGRHSGTGFLAPMTSADGLPADSVRSITKDRDGALWFGTLGGVGRYDTLTWQSLFAGQRIVGIAEGPQGDLWVATAENGLRYREAGVWRSVTSDSGAGATDGLPSDWIEALHQSADGALWVGTNDSGLARYDGQRWQSFTQAEDGLASDLITSIFEDRDGAIWVGTYEGLNRFSDGRWDTFRVGTECGVGNDVILALAQDVEGILWVGTQAGLCRYDGQQWLEPVTRMNSGLAADEVRSILPRADGTVWFGTWGGGVTWYDGSEWYSLTTADGLAANAIFTIIEDLDGVLWFGTLTGATRYDGSTWLSHTTTDGLMDSVVRVIYQEEGGAVWLGTQQGLSRYDADPGVPSAHVVGVNGEDYEGGVFPLLTGEPLAFDIDGGDLRTPRQGLVFECYLEGLQSDWQPCRSPSYSSLPRGKHTFHLRVRDEDFNYSATADAPVSVNPGVTIRWLGRLVVVPVSAFASVVIISLVAVLGLGLYAYTRQQTRRRGRGAMERKFNPYISGEPVRREDMFFGRSQLMRRILQTLHNNSLMVHGERRIGKTTLLYQLANRLRGEPDPEYLFVPVLIDLEGTPSETLFHSLMDAIVWTCKSRLPEMPELAFDNMSETEYSDRDFSRDLGSVVAALKTTTEKQVRVILLMDEMDAIDTYGRMVQLQLRRIFMTEFARNLGAVVAGVQISKKWDRPESPWYNLFIDVEMPPFSEEDARRLIIDPVKGVYRYEEAAVQRIISHGKGRPYRLQQYCLEAVNHMLADGRKKVRLADVEAAHRTLVQTYGDRL